MPGEVPDRVFVYRIVHFENLPGIIEEGGIWCGGEMASRDLPYKQIGLQDLTTNRQNKAVPINPGGNLSEYVPFHFCPRSVMLYQIHTGRVPTYLDGQEPVVHIVSSVEKVQELEIPFVFTDRHAKTTLAEFYNQGNDLAQLDWDVIRSRNFAKTDSDPDRSERKGAEFLVKEFLPVHAILGIGVINDKWKTDCDEVLRAAGVNLKATKMTGWYF